MTNLSELADLQSRKAYMAARPASITITVGDESTNVRTVVGQIVDHNGAPCSGKRIVRLTVYASTAQAALATGGSTGLAVASGTILLATHTAKLVIDVLSDANGKVNLTWTDTGTESVAVSMSADGAYGLSAAFANA